MSTKFVLLFDDKCIIQEIGKYLSFNLTTDLFSYLNSLNKPLSNYSVCLDTNKFSFKLGKDLISGKILLIKDLSIDYITQPELKEFYKKIYVWLTCKGYVETFSNHPSSSIREFHFIKDGIRVICVKGYEEYCYLSKDILNCDIPMTLKTGRFCIEFSELEELHNSFKNMRYVKD